MRRVSLALALIAAAALSWFAPRAATADDFRPLDIVATTGMIADAARAVAGERAEVTNLMGEGVDPHTYRQTRSDVVKLGAADLILWNGLYLEAQLEDLLERLAGRQKVVAVAERLPEQALLESLDYPGRHDPHLWMDVDLWSRIVGIVQDVLIEHDPEGRDVYAGNAEAYLEELARLGAYARKALASVPEGERVLVTAHDAFSYFGRAYDFEVIGIQGISTDSEAGLRQIEDLVALIVERGIRSVFVETSVADRNVRALVEGAAARGHELTIGGELFSDAMGAPGTYEGTYLGMIDHNVTTITRALGGDAPEAGMDGRLRTGS